MLQYFIRRILLIIPTFLGVTFLVFFILQIAPDGPFDRALNKMKNNQEGGAEVSMTSADSEEALSLSEEDIENLKAEFGLDKPLPIRYLIWLGLYDKQIKKKNIKFNAHNGKIDSYNEYFRDVADELVASDIEKFYLQKWVQIEKYNNKFILSESGVGLETELPIIDYFIGEKFTDSNANDKWDDAEPFIDKGNNKWDDAEQFIDLGNGKYDYGENFIDLNSNREYDFGENFTDQGNGKWNEGEEFIDKNNNNKWDDSEKLIDQNNNKIWDEGENFVDVGNGIYDDNESFSDLNENGKWDPAEFFIDTHQDNKYNPPIKNFNIEKYNAWINNYTTLPDQPKIIKTWYETNWILKEDSFKSNLEKNELISEEYTFAIFDKNGILNGHLGKSRKLGDVSTLISERIPISATFGLTSLILTYLVCIPLGIFKAIKNGSRFDLLSSIFVFIGYSIPGYILGAMIIIWIGPDGFLPITGWQSPDYDTFSFTNKVIDRFKHAFLPILCYMVGAFAWMTVLMKNSLLENLSQDYVRTAFAKGLSERRVIFFHAVRNSLIPLATGIGGMITVFLAGSYLIEKTFAIDGLGLLGFRALLDRDYDIIMGSLAITTILSLIGNLISDLVYALLDPRIRFK